MKKHQWLLACAIGLVANLTAQTKDSAQLSSDSKKTAPKPYNSIITKNAKTTRGLFTVHKIDDKYYFEVGDSVLDRDILIVSRLAKASADMRSRGSMNGYAGDELNEEVVRFEKGPNNKIFIRNLSYSERSADSAKPMYKAVMNSNVQPIVQSFDIKAVRKDSLSDINNFVIDMTDIMNSDNDLFFFGPSKQAFKIGAYQPDKSYLLAVKTYPFNTEIKTVKTYTKAPIGMMLAMGSQTPTPMGPSGNFTVEINTSLVLLPKQPMKSRYADDRVGYFTTGFTDFDLNPQGVKRVEAIERWRLEPRTEDLEKYKRGELVEPKKQIVIYVDPATPAKWVPYLIQGINDWNVAFEKAGFKNAITGKKAPTYEEDSTWSLDDARHSALIYKPSSVANASGPQISDPRSGEIIETHINWYHNIMKLVHDWYFIQASAVDTGARHMEFDDALMGQLIRFVSSHEVGHTLGLLHNFGASAATPVEKLRDNKWLTVHGHTSSIMDYARFNYVAQPEDSILQSNLFPRIGDYDKWAIEWGYKLIPDANTAEKELPVLNQWIIEKSKDKRYWFGSERSQFDPRSQNEDLGDNAMKAGEYGIKNLKRVLQHLTEWTMVPNEGYDNLYNMYNELIGQFNRYMGHVVKNVGGVYESSKSVEQPGPVYEIVSAGTQKEAIAFLNKQLFMTPDWLVNPHVLSYLGLSPVSIIGSLQENSLSRLLETSRLNNLFSAEASNINAYKVADLFKDLQSGIWAELDKKQSISIYRRNLQKAYLGILFGFMKSSFVGSDLFTSAAKNSAASGNANTDVVSYIKANLLLLKTKINSVLPFMKDQSTLVHLKDVVDRINIVLDLKK